MPKPKPLQQKLHFLPLPEWCSLYQIIPALIHGQDYYTFIHHFMLKARAISIPLPAIQTLHEWCSPRECVAVGPLWDASGHPFPAAHSSDVLIEGAVSAGRRRWAALALARGPQDLSVQTKNDLFTSSFWRKEKNSRDILIRFYAELFLDVTAASHVEFFVSFEFLLNCIISASAPWCIMVVLFAESLIISSGLLSEDQFISSVLWSLRGNNCSC